MFDFAHHYVLIIVLVGTSLLGAVSGVIGVFSTLRKQALIGDTISHATLPGVVLSFIFFNQRSLPVLLIGATVSSIIAIILTHLIKKHSKIKNDASLAIILSSFFGFGQVLLSLISNNAGVNQAGLSTFIFGQAATMSVEDIYLIIIVLSTVLITVLLIYKEIKLFIFNESYYQTLGFNPVITKFILSTLTILIIIVSIKSVGVVLMSAMLIAPAVAARQWSNRLSRNLIIAALFGAISGFIGTFISSRISKMPTGPVIVLVASIFVLISIIFSPKKGILSKYIKMKKMKKKTLEELEND